MNEISFPHIPRIKAAMARADRMTKDARIQSTVAVVMIIIACAVLAAAYFVLGTGR